MVDKKLIVGAVAAGITGALAFLGQSLSIPASIVTGAVALVAWLAAWINGRNNT